MFWPILYTALTTIIAFLSLIFSEIKPIIDFGWMMTLGLITSFVITFTLLPSLINFMPKEKIFIKKQEESKITSFFAQISLNNHKTIFTLTIVVIIFSLIGISKLEVENSFINYFSKDTEIYKGMKLIDEKLGGTTPLNIILKFDNEEIEVVSEEEDQFEDWDEESNEDDQSKYWFTKDKIDRIRNVHLYFCLLYTSPSPRDIS